MILPRELQKEKDDIEKLAREVSKKKNAIDLKIKRYIDKEYNKDQLKLWGQNKNEKMV